MKYLLYLLVLFCFFSCDRTAEQREESEQPSEVEIIDEVFKPLSHSVDRMETEDSITLTQEIEVLKPEDYNISSNETANLYLDRVYYFKSTNEFYVSLSFNEGYTYDSIRSIRTQLDTVVYDDGEIRRTSLSQQVGRKYFNTTLIDEITIFDYSHTKIQKSQLKRIEFFQDLLGDEFIAVFDSNDPQEQFEFYGIGGTNESIKNFQTREVNDGDFIQEFKDELDIQEQYSLRSSSVEISSFGTTLISFAYHTYNNTAVTYIIERKEDSVNTLLRFEDEYYIWQLIPTSILYKNQPILLLWLGLPETDIEWYVPAVFDGTNYNLSKSSRINLDSSNSSPQMAIVDSIKCSSSVLLETLENIDSLSSEHIDLFLKTFSASCTNNAEFSEFSQELIFEVFGKYPNEVVQLITENDYDLESIAAELKSPLLDPLIEPIITQIKSTGISNAKIDKIIAALEEGNKYLNGE